MFMFITAGFSVFVFCVLCFICLIFFSTKIEHRTSVLGKTHELYPMLSFAFH